MSHGIDNRGFVRCSNCGYPQNALTYNSPGFSVCPHCNSALRITAFPALYAQKEVDRQAGEVSDGSAATCFYHPTRAAVAPCGSCGRYLCTLCEIELGSETICPGCLDRASREEKVADLVESRTLYDSIALNLAVIPVLFWFITFITAPISIYITIRHWRTPLSILPRSRYRFVLAFIISAIQISLWSFLLLSVLS